MIAADYLTTIAYITATLVAAGLVARLLRDVYRWARTLERTLSYVAGEMRFNGGSTMRDAIQRIEHRQATADADRTRLGDQVALLERHLLEQDRTTTTKDTDTQ